MSKSPNTRIADKLFDVMMDALVKIMGNRPLGTGQIAEHVFAVQTGSVNFFIYKKGEDAVCIDTGLKKELRGELGSLGISPERISHVFLTHTDIDHTGGLAAFGNAKICLSADEEPMITNKTARALGIIHNPGIKRPYQLLGDGETVFAGEIKIAAIATPGHTPGSMCYLVDDTALFVGDTFKLMDGKVQPIRRFNMDTERQKESIRKLANLAGVLLACTGHRGYTEEFDEAIRDWKTE
jgi:hydroxyacylglutathione hydrolase